MIRIYSKKCEHAIRILSSIRRDASGRRFSLKSVCRRAKTPEWPTRKTLQALVHHGILAARPGPGGGYEFRTSPEKISVLQLILAVDGAHAFDRCILGPGACRRQEPCVLHEIWEETKTRLVSRLDSSNLARMMKNNE